MHQHPRSPAPAAPTPTARPSSARSGPRRENYAEPTPSSPDALVDNARGLGIETAADPSADQTQKNAAPSREAVAKLNQIIANYHTKAALIILHSRVELPPSFSKGADTPKVNRWFNVELDETDLLRDQLKIWRMCDAAENRPPPMIIETYLDGSRLTNNQSLVIIDDAGKRWDVLESLATFQNHQSIRPTRAPSDVILERWKVELGETATTLPADLGSILPTVYKKSIVLFRSLFTYTKFLPAWKFAKRNGKSRVNPALRIRYRIVDGATIQRATLDTLPLSLCEGNGNGNGKVVDHYNFGVTDSPAGPFSIEVTYRTNCDFRVDDSEALLSSRFMGADDEFFRPSLPSEQTKVALPEVGSLPAGRNAVEQPDRSLAYGSLSTFHQVGPTTSPSPISTLRAAQDSGASSPSPSSSPPRKLLPAVRVGPTGRAAALAMESDAPVVRRPSISFQPFKAPPLSASPSLVDPPLGTSPRTVPPRGLTGTPSDSLNMQPPLAAPTRKPAYISPELAMPSSTSASPKPAPISRYSSSFSHRRVRPSSGGANKAEDETSSGKASAASSAAQPGSGLLADPTGTSADSYHADDENISEFLKMLDLRKDLLNPTSAAAHEATTRKTTAALNRFQRMRDSNAVLSDSMSSSLLLHRSSNASSKQLSGVPPMAAGTSVSTASSPGKPLSPHTPHTPAIPSRLSFNSIVDHTDRDATRHRMSTEEHDSLMEEDVGDDITLETGPSGVNAIDIPTSPRPFASPYRRSSSVAQRRRTNITDEDDIFPFGMRSVSLGAEERAGVSLGALRQQELANPTAHPEPASRAPRVPGSTGDDSSPTVDQDADGGPGRAPTRPMPPTGSTSSTGHLYQPRFASSRARGSSGGPHSLSSASGSVPRGTTALPHLSERDPDRDGSGSNSGNSTMELRRGSGQRSTGSTSRAQHPSQSTPVEEDEPLLFAMSDFGVSRRSLEEGRPGAHGNDSSSGTGPGGSRRGSGRRGAGFPAFHAWS